MRKEYTLTPKFKLIADHLKAVRTLDEYVNGVGLKKDMQDLATYLQRDLSRGVLRQAEWEELHRSGGCLYSSPLGISTRNAFGTKWCVVEDDYIAIEIYPALPVRADCESYVNLHVPENWEHRQEFIANLKSPPGPDERFDTTGFIEAFREATKALVAMEKEVDQILEHLG